MVTRTMQPSAVAVADVGHADGEVGRLAVVDRPGADEVHLEAAHHDLEVAGRGLLGLAVGRRARGVRVGAGLLGDPGEDDLLALARGERAEGDRVLARRLDAGRILVAHHHVLERAAAGVRDRHHEADLRAGVGHLRLADLRDLEDARDDLDRADVLGLRTAGARGDDHPVRVLAARLGDHPHGPRHGLARRERCRGPSGRSAPSAKRRPASGWSSSITVSAGASPCW